MPHILLCPSINSTTESDKKRRGLFLLEPPSDRPSPTPSSRQPPLTPLSSLCTPSRSPNFYFSHSNALSPFQPLSQQLALPFFFQPPSQKYGNPGRTPDSREADDAIGRGYQVSNGIDAVCGRREKQTGISDSKILDNPEPPSPGLAGLMLSPKRRWCPLHGHMYCPAISPACVTNQPFLFQTRSSSYAVANNVSSSPEPSTSLRRCVNVWLYSPHHGWYGRGRIQLPLVSRAATDIDSPPHPRPSSSPDGAALYVHPDSILWAAIKELRFRSLKKRKSLRGLGVVPLSTTNGVGTVVKRDQWIPVDSDGEVLHFGIIVSDLPVARHRPHRKFRPANPPPSWTSGKPSKAPKKPPSSPVSGSEGTEPPATNSPETHTAARSLRLALLPPPIQIEKNSGTATSLSLESPAPLTSPPPTGEYQTTGTESPVRTISVIFCTLAVSANILAFLTSRFADTETTTSGIQERSPFTSDGWTASERERAGTTSRSRRIPFRFLQDGHHTPTPVYSGFSPLHRDDPGKTHSDDHLPMIYPTHPCTASAVSSSASTTFWIYAFATSLILVLIIAVFATGIVYRRSVDRERGGGGWLYRRVFWDPSGNALLQRPEWYLRRLGRGSDLHLDRVGSDDDFDGSETRKCRDLSMVSRTGTEGPGCSSPTDPPIVSVPVPVQTSKDRYLDAPSSFQGAIATTTKCEMSLIPTTKTAVGDQDGTNLLSETAEQPINPDDWEFALIHAARPRSWDGESTRLCTHR